MITRIVPLSYLLKTFFKAYIKLYVYNVYGIVIIYIYVYSGVSFGNRHCSAVIVYARLTLYDNSIIYYHYYITVGDI